MVKFKNILVPVDFSAQCNFAFSFAIDMAKFMDSKLHVIHVIEKVIYPTNIGLIQLSYSDVEGNLEEQAKRELENMRKLLAELDIRTDISFYHGKPFDIIIKYAEEYNIDLICISTYGKSGIGEIIFGTTAEKIITHAKCPVLAVRSPSVQ